MTARPDVAAILAREKLASAGPWSIELDGVNDVLYVECDHNARPWNYIQEMTDHDRAFINAARMDVPQLCARVTELEAALRSIEANSCCQPCREAGLVARAALEGGE